MRAVDWMDSDAIALRAAMIAEMNILYGRRGPIASRDGVFGVDPGAIVTTVVVYDSLLPVGHAALRNLSGELEIKRMYVAPERRGSGVAEALLTELEQVARDDGARRIILHTGDRQRAAIAFYGRHGYTPIPIYEPYVDLPESRCFEKVLP